MKKKLLVITVAAAMFLNACQPTPINRPQLKVGPAVAPESRATQYVDTNILTKTPYKGRIKVSIDTGLMHRPAYALATAPARKVFNISSKHDGLGNHDGKNPDLYFNPDKLSQDLDPYLGDTVVSGQPQTFNSASSINGQYGEKIAHVIAIKYRSEHAGRLQDFLAKYKATVLRENDHGEYTVHIDPSTVHLSELLPLIEKYNQYSPAPVTDLAFSSLASAQTTTVLMDVATNEAQFISYVHPITTVKTTYLKDSDSTGVLKPSIQRSSSGELMIDNVDSYIRTWDTRAYERNASKIAWLRDIGIPESRVYALGETAKVAVIDQGFSPFESGDLPASRIEADKANFTYAPFVEGLSPDTSLQDDWVIKYHGTAVAMVIGAEMDNGFGTSGVAPRSSILKLRAGTTMDEIAKAIDYAVDKKVDVINISQAAVITPEAKLVAAALYIALAAISLFFGTTFSPETPAVLLCGSSAAAIRRAENAGIPVVAGVGNNNLDVSAFSESTPQNIANFINSSFTYPASIKPVIGVGGASDQDLLTPIYSDGGYNISPRPAVYRDPALGSNHGPVVDIYAPQHDVEVSDYGSDPSETGNFRGTSAATPIVAGVIALMKGNDHSLTPQAIRNILFSRYSRLINGKPYINALAAIETVSAPPMRDRIASEIRGTLRYDSTNAPYIDVASGTPNFNHVYIYSDVANLPRSAEGTYLSVAGWNEIHGAWFNVIAVREIAAPPPPPPPPPPPANSHFQVAVATDSTWSPNSVIVPGNSGWNQDIVPGAHWVWDTAALDDGGFADIYREFVLPSNAKNIAGYVDYGFDDGGDVYINGDKVVTHGGNWYSTSRVDITGKIVPGTNRIRLYGYNGYNGCGAYECNPSGIIGRAVIDYDL